MQNFVSLSCFISSLQKRNYGERTCHPSARNIYCCILQSVETNFSGTGMPFLLFFIPTSQTAVENILGAGIPVPCNCSLLCKMQHWTLLVPRRQVLFPLFLFCKKFSGTRMPLSLASVSPLQTKQLTFLALGWLFPSCLSLLYKMQLLTFLALECQFLSLLSSASVVGTRLSVIFLSNSNPILLSKGQIPVTCWEVYSSGMLLLTKCFSFLLGYSKLSSQFIGIFICVKTNQTMEKSLQSHLTNSDQGKQTIGVKKPMDSGGLIFPPLWPSNQSLRYLSLQTYQVYIRNNLQPL